MKLQSIDIRGMNRILQKKYTFQNDVVYLNGKNGVGKSTVLKAIQLALLGYIPGLAKKNDSIMKHANGPFLSVVAALSDDKGNAYQISRVYTMDKRGVTCSVSTTPEDLDISEVLGELELPVFNFNEFMDMSANKLKDWFISFLPSRKVEVDWDKELKQSIGDLQVTDDQFYEDILKEVELMPGDGIDKIRAVNAYLKQMLSFKKSELTRMDSSIQSLIFYDDYEADMSIEDMRNQIRTYEEEYKKYIGLQKSYEASSSIRRQLAQYEDLAEDMDHDEDLQLFLKDRQSTANKIQEIQSELNQCYEARADLKYKLSTLSVIANGDGTCPYTGKVCESIYSKLQEGKNQADALRLELANLEQREESLNVNMRNFKRKLDDIYEYIASIEGRYSDRDRLRGMVHGDIVDVDIEEINRTVDDINAKLENLKQSLIKAQANERYNELINVFTRQKYDVQQSIEALKVWIKLTGENGLQTQFMSDPFADLGQDLSKYLKTMFNDPSIEAHFNLTNKVNSFSFGIDRDGVYVPFDGLSSGEKCIYTLALLTCLVSSANSPLKLILIDDLFDHLDDENIENVFQAVKSISDIQYIFAGVKSCKSAKPYTIAIE